MGAKALMSTAAEIKASLRTDIAITPRVANMASQMRLCPMDEL